MRLITVLTIASLGAGCVGKAPGAPLTDVSATNTENTGSFEVVERTNDDGILRLKAIAAQPERAKHVAGHLLYQALPTASRGVVVEVYAGESTDGDPVARAEARQDATTRVRVPPQPSEPKPGAADRQGVPNQHP
jgi:hypothetical protein